MPGSARDEAERLVATVLAMAGSSGARDQVGGGLSALAETLTRAVDRIASAGTGGHEPAAGARGGWATGSAECCVCPVCKAIAAARDPSPATVVRLASGAGDIATGVASLMRSLSSMAGQRPKAAPRPAPPPPGPAETWSAATRAPANRPSDAWAAATNSSSPADAAATAQDSGADPWAAASAAGAAAAEADRAEARARREAAERARIAAQEAARRVAEAAALAKAAKKAAEPPRAPERFDVWAAATADAGVADPARPTALDHDVPDAAATGESGDAAGDVAHGGDAV